MAGVYKRGKVYWGRVQRKGREFRQSLKTGDRRLAEVRMWQWLDQLNALAWGDRPRVTFREAARAFMTEHMPRLQFSSARRYAVSMKWLAEKFEDRFLDEIDRASLSDFESWRRGAHEAAAPTVRRDLACLSSILTMCEDKDWLEEGKNPVPGFLRRRAKRGLKEAPGRTRYLTEREEAALLNHAVPIVADAIMLAVDTGLRREELFTLTWGQVDLRRGIIVTTTRTKSGRARPVPLSNRSARLLAHRKTVQSVTVRSLFIFAHEDGARFANFEKGFKAAARRAQIADVRWHDLRRTAGCRWLQRDRRSMEEVSVMLGHSSIAVTEKSYAFLDLETVAISMGRGADVEQN